MVDFLVEHPSINFTPQEFVALLPKLQPRLYSIASSLKAYPDAVHFIVDVVRYKSHGRQRKGVCSSFLAERCSDSPAPIFPTISKFRLPEDATRRSSWSGRAPASRRSALFCRNARRSARAAKTWLFFGAQREKSDFFTRTDFEKFMANGILTRLDTAFSRDQAHKIYVQDRMLGSAGELWKWLEEGAHFYVCGDAKRMAKDVDATLRQIVQQQSGEELRRSERIRRETEERKALQARRVLGALCGQLRGAQAAGLFVAGWPDRQLSRSEPGADLAPTHRQLLGSVRVPRRCSRRATANDRPAACAPRKEKLRQLKRASPAMLRPPKVTHLAPRSRCPKATTTDDT